MKNVGQFPWPFRFLRFAILLSADSISSSICEIAKKQAGQTMRASDGRLQNCSTKSQVSADSCALSGEFGEALAIYRKSKGVCRQDE